MKNLLGLRNVSCALALFLPVLGFAADLPPTNVEIRTLSNRADLVSSGDALVEVRLPVGVASGQVSLRLNGAEVTSMFQFQPGLGRFVGLLSGLVEGVNTFTAVPTGTAGGRPFATLTITNHSRGGPVFSGPQLQPWVCATRDATTITVTVPGTTLSAPTTTKVSGLDSDPVDAKCNAPSKFTYFYQPKALEGTSCTFTIAGTNPCFVPYDPASPPASAAIATFINDRGATVRSIVRVERGTMDRGIYELVSFYDPATPSSAINPQPGWNGKLLWMFGASASGSRYQTPTTTNTIFNEDALRKGFMVAQSSLNNNGTNANHILAAESLMMVKEHIIEQYGPIRYTIGNGCSGGSIQQQTIAGSFPGLIDGIQPNCSYMDQANIEMEIKDCGLLAGNYFVTTGAGLSPEKRAAIGGQANPGFCTVWVSSFVPAYNPTLPGNCGGLPAALIYDPVSRPQGLRCDLLDHEGVRLGSFIDTDGVRKANDPYDNVGVQYGLKALQQRQISVEEFLALNENIGSYSVDLQWTGPAAGSPTPPPGQIFGTVQPAARIAASPSTLARLYYSGMAGDAHLLSQVAIIDLRGNQNPAGDIHANWRSWSMRARLDAANGQHDNQVIWASTPGLAPGAALARKAFLTMDTWLAGVESDASTRSRAEKIIASRPTELRDMCLTTTGATDAEVAADVGLGTSACPVFPWASPRQTAGGPLTEDIYKCQTKPVSNLDPAYGGATFTLPQMMRLKKLFATSGVCDWIKPGVSQQPSPGWVSFETGNPVALPPPPVSSPL
jgi:hypothetical protein